jgi:fructose-1,6-bisphosphatase/inositol monophosphatase family enzyme
MAYERELQLARQAAVRAGENAVRMRGAGIQPEMKPDNTPVTPADRENERLIVEFIEAEFPNDGILGEEGTRKKGTSGRRWIIDPIDGTRDFIRGNALWCVLIAMEERGAMAVGVAHFPMSGETFWAARGGGAYRNGERIHVLEETRNGSDDWRTKIQKAWGTGGAREAMRVASGEVEVWFERRAKVWDMAPLQVIIEEAGGRFFAMDGTSRADGGSGVACIPAVENEVREFLRRV